MGVAQAPRCNLVPLHAQQEMPNMVTRPVITSMAQAIRLPWRRVVVVTLGGMGKVLQFYDYVLTAALAD